MYFPLSIFISTSCIPLENRMTRIVDVYADAFISYTIFLAIF